MRSIFVCYVIAIAIITGFGLGVLAENTREKNKTKYRAPTHQEFVADYNIKAVEQMLEALKTAHIAGQIAEAINCPCYDIHVSSDPDKVFLRVDKTNCIKER